MESPIMALELKRGHGLYSIQGKHKGITGDTPGIDRVWVYKMPRPRSLVCKDPGHRSGHFINQGSWSGHFTTKYKPEKA